MAARSDKKRDAALVFPEDIEAETDIDYVGRSDPFNLMDIYYPKGTIERLPAIISIHGGGYVYGDKEVYRHYCGFLAELGFTVVNFNYHLAPQTKFPVQLTEINSVMRWVAANGKDHHIDTDRIFLVGDSAGAQMCSQYAAIFTNPSYEKLFSFDVPHELHVRAIALNCGVYTIESASGNKLFNTKGLIKDYFGKDLNVYGKMLDMLGAITPDYPPTYIMTSYYDFFKANAEPMYEHLRSKGIECICKCYGTKEQKYMGHVCHINLNLEEAKRINRDEAEFFKRNI